MSKQEEASLILKLYELRRDPVMRQARDWYFLTFRPQTVEEFTAILFGPHSGHLRMVVSYWDMAAAMVHHGAIDAEFFNDCNGEHIGVFARIEPLLGPIREALSPRFAQNLELLIDRMPDGRKLTAANREQSKAILERLAAEQSAANSPS